MRRERNGFRFAIMIFAIIAVIISILIGLLISRGMKKSRENDFAGQMSKLSEDLGQSDTVSTKIGKTVEQVEQDEEQQGFEVPTLNEEGTETNKSSKSKESKETGEKSKNKKEKSETGKNTNKENNEIIKTNSDNKTENEAIEANSGNTEKNTTIETNKSDKEDKIEMEAPIKGEIIRVFAKDSLVFSKTLQEWVTHNGVDIKADKTSVVKSAAKGTIAAIKNDPRYGLTVIINHDNGYQTIYSNLLTAEFVVKGENVEIGQSIGTVGNSASFEIEDEYHLHFELLKDNEYLNPTEFINF